MYSHLINNLLSKNLVETIELLYTSPGTEMSPMTLLILAEELKVCDESNRKSLSTYNLLYLCSIQIEDIKLKTPFSAPIPMSSGISVFNQGTINSRYLAWSPLDFNDVTNPCQHRLL